MQIDTADLLERFLRYVQIDTRSDSHSKTTPSTPGQWDLLRLLAAELTAMVATDVSIGEFGYVFATVPATSKKSGVPCVAFGPGGLSPRLDADERLLLDTLKRRADRAPPARGR